MIKAMPTVGKSMEYIINQNDIVVYTDDTYSIIPGDIILYKGKMHNIVCHRLHFITKLFYITAGDNCYKFEIISKKNIIGKVIYVYNNSYVYELNKHTFYKKKYNKFIKKMIIKLFFFHLFDKKVFHRKAYKKIIDKRNKLQKQYLHACKILN